MVQIRASKEYREKLKAMEGFRAEPYEDVDGRLAQGYGDTVEVTSGTITPEEADARLDRRLQAFEQEVGRRITRTDLSQGQIDTLVDMAYNVGPGNLQKEGFFDLVNSGDDDKVYESIGRFTKARNKEGQLIELPGLVARSKFRQELWGDPRIAPGIDFSRFIVAGPTPDAAPSIDFGKFVVSQEDDTEGQKTEQLKESVALAQDVDLVKYQQKRAVAEKFKIPEEEAEAFLDKTPFSQVMLADSLEDVRKEYPVVSSWASKPENMAVMAKDPSWARKVEETTTFFRQYGDELGNAITRGKLDIESMSVHSKMLVGLMSEEDGIAELRRIKAERAAHPLTFFQEGHRRITDAFEIFSKRLSAARKTYEAGKIAGAFDKDRLLPATLAMFGFSGSVDIVEAAYKNPAALSLFVAENAPSGLLSTAAGGVGGVAGAITAGPVGATVGALSAATVASWATEFAGIMDEEMGDVDPGDFYSDKERVARARKKALIKASVHAPFGAFISAIAGGGVAKTLSKTAKASRAVRIAKGAGAIVKEAGQQAGIEFAGETVSRLAAGETLESATSQGMQELVIAGAAGPVHTAIGFASKKTIDTAKKTEIGAKLAGQTRRAYEAALRYNALKQVREAFKGSTIPGEHPQQAEELLREATTRQPGPELADDATIEHPADILAFERQEALSEEANERVAETIAASRAGQEYTLTFDAQEWEVLHQQNGKDPDAAIRSFGPSIEERYRKARQENGFFTVTLAEYLRYQEADPDVDVDSIARFEDSDYNAVEALGLLDIVDDLPKKLFAPEVPPSVQPFVRIPLGDTSGDRVRNLDTLKEGDEVYKDGELIGKVSSVRDRVVVLSKGKKEAGYHVIGQDDITGATEIRRSHEEGPSPIINQVEAENVPEAPVLRSLDLLRRFRTDEEKEAFDLIKKRLLKATKPSGQKRIPKEFAELFAELQFRHVRFRAAALGLDVKEVAKALKIVSDPNLRKREKAVGAHAFPQSLDEIAGSFKVMLDPTATANIVVHEFAHVWLTEMIRDWHFIHAIDDDKLTIAQREYKSAMQETSRLFNVQLNELDSGSAEFLKVQETFAQTAEKYFLEGKFLNRLKHVFEMMRRWMREFTGIIAKSYPHFPPLQVSPEVERLFEILTDTSDRVEEIAAPLMPQTQYDPDMFGAKGAEYEQTILDVRSEVMGEIYAKSTIRNWREREKAILAALNEITLEAQEAVDEMPSMALSRRMREMDVRISFESFKDILAGGDEAQAKELRATIPKHIIAPPKKGGVDVRDVMLALRVADQAQLLTFLQEAGRREELVAQMADALIQERFPVLKTDEEIHEIAQQAVIDVGRDRLLAKELRLLADQHFTKLKSMIKSAIMPPQVLKKMKLEQADKIAKNNVLNDKVKWLRPGSYLASSQKQRRASARVFVKGNILAAFEFKYREAVDFFAFKHAEIAAKQVARVKEIIRSMSKRSVNTPYYDIDIYNFGRHIIGALATNNPLPRMRLEDFTPTPAISQQMVDAINLALNQIENDLGGRPVDEIQVKTYLLVGLVLAKIRRMSSQARKIELGEVKQYVEDAATVIQEEIGPRLESDPVEPMGSTLYQKLRIEFTTFETFIAGLFPENVRAKTFMQGIIGYAANAEAMFNAHKKESVEALRKALIKMAEKDKGIGLVIFPILRQMPKGVQNLASINKPIPAKELGANFVWKSKNDLIGALRHYGSESNLRKFLAGGYSQSGPIDPFAFETMIERMTKDGTLTKDHFDFLQNEWDFFRKHFEAAKRGVRKVHGEDMGEIEGRKIKTPWGTYNGGYVPLTKSDTYKALTSSYSDFTLDDFGQTPRELFPVSFTGMIEGRTEAPYEVSVSLEHIPTQYHRVLQMAYLKPVMFDIGKILNHQKVRAAIEGRRPGAYDAIIKPWFNNTMAQRYTEPDMSGVGEILHQVHANTYVAAFAGNWVSFFKQTLGLAPASLLLGRYLPRGMSIALTRPREQRDLIASLSPFMKDRFTRGYERFVLYSDKLDINGDWLSKLKDKSVQLSHIFVQVGQNITDQIIWSGAYMKALDNGLIGLKAIEEADSVVRRTQGSAAISARPPILQGPVWKRMLTMFATPDLAAFGLNTSRYFQDLDKPIQERVARQLIYYAVLAGFQGAISGLIMNFWRPEKEDPEKEEEEFEKDMVTAAVAGVAGVALPVVGPAIVMLARGRYGDIIPPFRSLGTLYRAGKAVAEAVDDVNLNPSHLRDLHHAFTMITGLPVLYPVTVPGRIEEFTETPAERTERLLERRYQLEERRALAEEAER